MGRAAVISGRQALATIEDAVARLRSDESRLDAALRSAAEQAARLRAERMAAFRELARVRLDALSRESVVGELDAVERRALDLVAASRRSFDGLVDRRRQAEEAVRSAEAERHARAEALERAIDALGDLRASIEARMRESPGWGAQKARIDQAIHVAAEAEKKAAQAEADREEKRKPYEADPLFMYLWRRRFGTGEYRAGPFVRFFDRKVARLVGYDKARANYVMLNEIPQRLREHAERVQAEIGAERAELAAVERAEMEKAGAGPLAERAADARRALLEAERALVEAKQALADLDREHDAVVGADGPEREAVELLASADSRQDLQELYREAARTATPKDEAIVRRIEQTEAAIGQAEQEIGAIRNEMRQMAQRRADIERERDEFRRRGYDNPWGTIRNDQVLGQVLGGILGGVISSTVLRDVLQEGYHRRQSPWDSDYGGGFPFPLPGGDRGGGWSGGGGGSGGPWGDITDGLWGGDGGSFGGGEGGDGFSTGERF
jgi:chromosome segregation ATPase